MGRKICGICGAEKVWLEMPSGGRWRCRPCHRRGDSRYRTSEKGRAGLRRWWTSASGKANNRMRQARARARKPERYAAGNFVRHALEAGRMSRRPCLVCGLGPDEMTAAGRPKVQAHHAWGYAPEDMGRVIWLCRNLEHGHPKADRDPAYNAELVGLHEFVESI